MPDECVSVACNLAAIGNRPRYQSLSNALRAAVKSRAELADGFAYLLDLHICGMEELREWMALERECCPFLHFDLSAAGSDPNARLALTGPAGTKEILDREFPAS
jgi:hypothetical protein